jgi:hypothetical protein
MAMADTRAITAIRPLPFPKIPNGSVVTLRPHRYRYRSQTRV